MQDILIRDHNKIYTFDLIDAIEYHPFLLKLEIHAYNGENGHVVKTFTRVNQEKAEAIIEDFQLAKCQNYKNYDLR